MPLLKQRHGPVTVITMSRPEARNCWGSDFLCELTHLFDEFEEDDGVGCVVITGDEAGQAFCAGANLKDPAAHAAKTPGEFIKALPKRTRQSLPNLITDFPKPVIAAVNGYAIGVGCIMACSCDLVVASERAEWRLSQANLGIMPQHAATVRTARWIGKANAMRLALGFPIDATEAYRIGLAQWLVPHEKLLEEACAVADHIARLPALAVRLIKESMNRGLDSNSLAEVALVDAYRAMILGQTADAQESHTAWRERRSPKFRGQ